MYFCIWSQKIGQGGAGNERYKRNNKMANIETRLNNAIEEHGFRISPRLSLEERMTRYIELSRASRGEHVSSEDAQTAAALILMGDGGRMSNESSPPTTPRRSTRLRDRAQFMEPLRTVSHTQDSLRVTFNTGTHPMVRRSQVNQH